MVMVDEKCRRDRRLVRSLCLLVEETFPPMRQLEGARIASVGHDDAARNVASVERLESSLRVHIRTLVPQLDAELLSVYVQYSQREVIIFLHVAATF